MKKKIILCLLMCLVLFGVTGCSEAERVEYNITKNADNFNVLREVTIINCLQGDVLFQMRGKMSITADTVDDQLEVIVENEDGSYSKHFVGLSDNVTYVIEDLDGNYVDKYQFSINYNPKMWIPVEFENID